MMIPEHAAANVKNRRHKVTARLTVASEGSEGVILAQGSYLGGWSLYLLDGRVRYAHNLAGRRVEHVGVDQRLAPGEHTVVLEVAPRPAGGADVTIEIDGALAATGEIRRLVFSRYSLTGAGLTCGYGLAPAVTDEYQAPFRFTGELAPVQVDLAGPIGTDPAEVADAAIATQ